MLRILLPFMLGILLHRWWHCWWAPLSLLALAVLGYLMMARKAHTPAGRLKLRPFFIVPLAVAAIALGWIAAVIHCPPRLDDEARSGRVLVGRVTDLQHTDFSMRLTIDLLDESLPPCRVMVSTRGCDYTMQPGDVVAWQGNLSEVGNLGNPDEMDYAALLMDQQGIRYQQHIPLQQMAKVGHAPTFMTRMAVTRHRLTLKVLNSRLSAPAQRFVTALLLGDSSLIDKATRQQFAAAGVAHVLALSGLHIGIIALIIWWLLFPLDYLRLKKLRLVITLAAITLFAVFTGLSPSVVRATVMTAVAFVSIILYRRSVALNSLAVAALVILVFSPSALYSVGFQLSFVTVGAVLLAQPSQAISKRHRWARGLITTAITSLVAMLATVALTAHYFHTVSLMSVLTNLLVLPVMPVFMVLGALFLLVTAGGMTWPGLNAAIDGIHHYITWTTKVAGGLPFSHINGVYVSTFGVIAYFVALLLITLWLYRRQYRYLMAAGATVVLMLAHSLWTDYNTPRQGLVIFNAYSSTPLLYYNDGVGYVWTPDDEETDSISFARYYAGFLARHRIGQLELIADDDSLSHGDAALRPPYAFLMGRRFMAVGYGKWKTMSTDLRLDFNDIIVTKRYHGSITKLQELYSFDRIVISGAHHEGNRLLKECDSLHIAVHDLSTQGALQITAP